MSIRKPRVSAQLKGTISPEKIIVIHPGSLNLYIGMSADDAPLTIPNCIARKMKEGYSPNSDTILESDDIDSRIFESGRDQIIKILTNMKYTEKNAKNNKEAVEEVKETLGDAEFYVGEEGLKALHSSTHELHFPFCFGRLNDRKRTLTATLADFREIITSTLTSNFEITDFSTFRVILVIPDIFSRSHVTKLIELFINHIGFCAIFVQQESVFATIAAGLVRACVVDVGHTKTSICCVEEGFIYPKTRLILQYGGKTISQVFRHVLRDVDLPADSDLAVEKLKSKYCSFGYSNKNRGNDGKDVEFTIESSEFSAFVDNIGFVLPPLTLFSSEMMKFLPKAIEIMPDMEDCLDDYLTCRPRKSRKSASQPKTDEFVHDSSDGGNAGCSDGSDDVKFYGQVDNLVGGKLQDYPSLAKAIVFSLDRCESDDLKGRMLASVLLVGGGMKFKGAHKFLQHAIRVNLPRNVQDSCEISVVSKPKNLEDEVVCWKGASIMAFLDSLNDLWVHKDAWNKFGSISLREKAPFCW